MGLSHLRLIYLWTLSLLPYLHPVWTLALPIEQQKSPSISSPRLSFSGGYTNGVTVTQIVTTLLDHLAEQQDIRFQYARLLGVYLRVSPGTSPSNNIADFQSIGCFFLYGGPARQPGKSNAFTIANQWPEHWEQWGNQVVPRLAPAELGEILWEEVRGVMDVRRADSLLKIAGYPERYRGVVLLKLGSRPLGYCFSGVDDLRDINVDVATGKVSEVRECKISLGGRALS
ncbi:MAG: hypothetical protein Q9186_003997 [Xanthomendoza sp. 1 TL-2023]